MKMPSKSRSWAKIKARDKNKAWLNPLKVNTGCKMCGYKHYNPRVFDFHHLSPQDKYKTKSGKIVHIADMMHYSIKTVMKEVKKCIVICKCCHAQIGDETLKGGV